MRRTLTTAIFIFVILAPLAVPASAQTLTIAPTTTYDAETGVNTSAPPAFATQSDGNLGGANVSKVDTRSLLYPGFDGKIYAHVVGWFGGTNHENIGYNSSDPAVVKAQINDMVSRGIDGIIHVWYGSGSTNISNLEAQAVMNEAPNHPGFTFAIMIDQGAVKWFSCYPSCTATQAVINLATYVANTYFPSPSYLRMNGRPVLTNFDIDGAFSVDWNAVAAAVPGNPIFLFQNSGGFTHTQTGGSYSWVMPSDSNYGLDYLSNFYSTGMKYPGEVTIGATYKGFNDTLAGWSMNRIMSQQCGQTWLSTFDRINSMYNSTNQLPMLQLVTWDDYEEGTEIETGIDNCVSVTASTSGTVLNWAISGGSENTIDHYTVFISTDGNNLMPLGDFVAGTHSLDISGFGPSAGTYTLYVKAVGKPSIANKMSNAATLTVGSAGVTIASPSAASTQLSPVHLLATASSSNGIAAMSSYIDDTKVYKTYTATTDVSLPVAPGSHHLVINAWDSNGVLLPQASQMFTVAAQPPTVSLSLSANSAVAPAAISATASATDPNLNGSISSYTINWGDGSTSTGASGSHTYSGVGTFAVQLTVTDNYGQSATATQTLTVSAAVAPTAAMTVSMSGPTATVSTSGSIAGSGTISSTLINWGDGTSTAGASASHTYNKGGYYNITATVTNSYGQSASTSQQVTAAGVVIWLPQTGTTASQPVHIAATAYDSKKIASMIIYVDSNKVWTGYVNDFDVWLNMRKGTHTILVKAWEDVTGVVYQNSVTFRAK